ncbi:MAG: hypothetical protein Q8N39_02685 [Pelolinea sp.]|nr:hypothetical protein [Pelolinea sp.]
MKLSAPKETTFWAATILGGLGIISKFVTIPVVSENAFWFVVVGFVVLWLGNTNKGF